MYKNVSCPAFSPVPEASQPMMTMPRRNGIGQIIGLCGAGG